MEKKFTPGTWRLNMADGTIRSKCWGKSDQMADYQGVIVTDLKQALFGSYIEEDVKSWENYTSGKGGRQHAYIETIANAKLIAAAPDLLKALQALSERYEQELGDGYLGGLPELDAAKAAIKEATEFEIESCHAHRDGDCFWDQCPQLRDNEPQRSGRHCPIDIEEERD